MQQNTKLVLRQCVAIVAKQMLNLGNQGGDKTPTNAELAFSTGKRQTESNSIKIKTGLMRRDMGGGGGSLSCNITLNWFSRAKT